jgi:CHAT domain-containing protein
MLASRDYEFRIPARALYDQLIGPIERDLDGIGSLLIIRDDILWRVPFSALVDQKGRFLVERAAIAYAASISVYVSMTEHRSPAEGATKLFAVANPTLDSRFNEAYARFRGEALGPLPDAEAEVDGLARLYGPKHSVILKRGDATEARTKAGMGGAEVVHFATHGLLDDRNPMYSRLALGRGDGTRDDGWLEAWEVAGLNIAADLVVLSACDTARGRVGGGEGVIGIAWSFFVAGARATVATEWKISSASTSKFMIAFHESLQSETRKRSFRKAHALREAQLEFLRSQRYQHPFYWAPFILIGDAS